MVLCLAGCDAILGLDTTQEVQCELAPFTPVFTSAATTVVTGCDSYVPSQTADLATAHCGAAIRESAVDATTMTDTNVPPPADSPRLAPDGHMLYVRAGLSFVAYARAAQTWTNAVSQTFEAGTGAGDVLSTPSDVPNRHIVLASQSQFTELTESSPGQWQTIRTYTPTDLGATAILDPNLSPDALRLVFMAETIDDTTPHVYIADRAHLDDMFSTARRVGGTPPGSVVSSPYLTPGCDRLYFTQNGSVSYVTR